MKKTLSILFCAFILAAPGLAFAYGTPVFDAEYGDGNTWGPTTGNAYFSSQYNALSNVSTSDTLYYSYCVHQTQWAAQGSVFLAAYVYDSSGGGGTQYIDGTAHNFTGTALAQACYSGSAAYVDHAITAGNSYATTLYISGYWGGNTYTWGPGDYFRVADGGPPPGPTINTQTRIISVTPPNLGGVATTSSTTIGASVYVNPVDYRPGSYVQIRYAPNSAFQASVASPDLLYTTLNFQIATSGESDFGTSSPISTTGQFTMITTLYNVSQFSFFNWFTVNLSKTALTSTTTTFVVGVLSPYDNLVINTAAILQSYANSASSSLSNCGFTTFDFTGCATALLIPNMASTTALMLSFKNGFLSYAPWGYVTRFMTIMTGNGSTTSSLPVLDATIPLPDGTPANFYVDPNTFIPQGGAILNSATATFGPGQGESFQTIIEPVWDEMLALLVTLAIIFNMMGTHKEGGGRHRGKLS